MLSHKWKSPLLYPVIWLVPVTDLYIYIDGEEPPLLPRPPLEQESFWEARWRPPPLLFVIPEAETVRLYRG